MSTALATDAESTWKKLLDGQSGIRKLTDWFVEEYDLPVRIGGHLLDEFDSELTRVELRRLSYLQKMSTVIGRRVWAHAGSPEVDARRLMVSIGTGRLWPPIVLLIALPSATSPTLVPVACALAWSMSVGARPASWMARVMA
jgi:hypothetical protein